MKRYISILVIFLVTTLPISSAFSADKVSLVKQNIEMSGLDDFIASVPGYLEMSMNQRLLTSENPEIDSKINNILIDSYNETKAREDLFTYVHDNTEVKNLIAVSEWYQTEIAKNISLVEEETSRPEAQAEMLRYLADLQESPLPQDRIQLVQKLVSEAKLVDHSMSILLSVIKGVIESMSLSLPPEKRLDTDQLNDLIANLKTNIEPGLRQQVILGSFYSYRDISNSDLTKYIEFLTSKNGIEFTEIGYDAIAFVLSEYFADAGEEIAQLAKSETTAQKQSKNL